MTYFRSLTLILFGILPRFFVCLFVFVHFPSGCFVLLYAFFFWMLSRMSPSENPSKNPSKNPGEEEKSRNGREPIDFHLGFRINFDL